jgi:hypothetical protein
LLALWLSFSVAGHAAAARSPRVGTSTGPVAQVATGTEEPAPSTAPRRLVTQAEKDSRPDPALWVGVVMGVSGLIGLAFSLGGRERPGGAGS